MASRNAIAAQIALARLASRSDFALGALALRWRRGTQFFGKSDREATMTDQNKWRISGWGAAQGQIEEAVHFLCKGRERGDREEIAGEIVALVRAIARGEEPGMQSAPDDREERARESWARMVARHVVDGALAATERSDRPDQVSLLREIAKRALWQMPNSVAEVGALAKVWDIKNLKQPHPSSRDDPCGRV